MNTTTNFTIHDCTGAIIGRYASAEDAAYHFRQLDDAEVWRRASDGELMGRRLRSHVNAPLETGRAASFGLEHAYAVEVGRG